ncbi:MAG: YCF48-related protein [Pseudomonadota bacterium]
MNILFKIAATALAIVASYYLLTPAMADPLAVPARSFARAPERLMLAMASTGPRLVAAGERGIVIYSDDKGAHWKQANVPVSVTLTGLFFTDLKNGWAVGHDGALLGTTDGGLNWQKRLDGNAINKMMETDAKHAQETVHANPKATPAQLEQVDNAMADLQAASKFGPSRPLLAVWFRTARLGWVVGAYGQALRTRDGGATWESVAARMLNPEGLHYNAIGHSADGALLIAGEGGRVYRSADDGDTWTVLNTGYKGQLYGVIEPEAGALLAFGFGGHVLRSADAGAHWQELPALGKKTLVGSVPARDGALLLVARDGSQYRSDDKGRSFQPQGKPGNLELSAALRHAGLLVLAGVGGVQLPNETQP